MTRRKSKVKLKSTANTQGGKSTSIQGCSQIVRAENQIIRFMWATYLCFTTLFLHISIMKLVYEYMEHAVNIQTYNDMDPPITFPTVTFCNHQPFSARAYELWGNKSLISPTHFNQLIRQRAAKLLAQSVEIPKIDNESVRLLDRDHLLEFLRQAIVYDTLPLYYQSLPWPSHLQLGHSSKHLIALWLLRYSSNVEIVKEYSQHIKELGLVLWLGPDENYGKKDRQAFLFGLFNQAYGLRVSIHEPGQMANLNWHSFQVAPG
ncbi:amiloride-sensitive sodium channel-related protein [Echinococcus granulosus]|uniref:Amiloride-sensitive sodium channel-related protein n=1 Tax=Echinococcus granulosus TaxID=6210 RepID=W6TYL0_ECHGR|nr:amiloride-sensitive sodium channel-related protein [Echinococcus granulosus]EUB53875.1 amiloride-sensitive sodium channel-related protein [Echinococcus granulosus]